MKFFTEPSVEVIRFAVEDVITVSGDGSGGGESVVPGPPGLIMLPPCV